MSGRPSAMISTGWVELGTYSEGDPLYDGDEVITLHASEIQPVGQFSKLTVGLRKVGQPESVTYLYPKNADFVGQTWLSFTTPDITVKNAEQPNWRIAYARNLGHNVIRSLSLQVNDVSLVTIDSVAMDLLSESNLKAGIYEGYQQMIGNVAQALTFGAHLPPIEVTKPLHELWFSTSSSRPSQMLPLCALKHNTFTLRVEFVESLETVIRVQKNYAAIPGTDPDDWRNEDPAGVNLSTLVDTAGTAGLSMPVPDAMATVALVQKEERNHHQGLTKRAIIRGVQSFTGPQWKVGTHRATFRFNYAVEALWWALENQNSRKLRNLSNYSTNAGDSAGGINPVRKVTLWYDNQPRFQNFPASHFTQLQYLQSAERIPTVTGHHLLAYGYSTTASSVNGSCNLAHLQTDLEVEINETSTNSDDAATDPCDYKLQIRGQHMLVVEIKEGSIAFLNN